MTELTLTANPYPHSLGDDRLADRCRLMIKALQKIGIGLIPKRVNESEIEIYYPQRELTFKLCQDTNTSDPYLVEAWVIFESLSESDSDYLYQQLQEIGIFDDFNYQFEDEEDY